MTTQKVHQSFRSSSAPVTRMSVIALALLTMSACSSSNPGLGTGPGAGTGIPAGLDGPNDPIVDWSVAAYDGLVAEEKYGNPLRAARVMSMMHLAQHDALVAIRPAYAAHALDERAPGADPVAAAASAAFEVLATELPGQRTAMASRLERSLAAVPQGAAREQGLALGQRAAAAIVERRRADGADVPAVVPYKPEEIQQAGPGVYRPIAPANFLYAPAWRSLRPFALQSPEQFRVAPPPALDSAAYAAAFSEVKRLGVEGQHRPHRRADAPTASSGTSSRTSAGTGSPASSPAEPQAGLAGDGPALRPAEHGAARMPTWPAGTRSSTTTSGVRPRPSAPADSDGNPATAPDPSWESRGADAARPGLPLDPQRARATPPPRCWPTCSGTPPRSPSPPPPPRPATAPTASPASPRQRTRTPIRGCKAGLHFRFACQAGQALGRQVGSWVVPPQLRPTP